MNFFGRLFLPIVAVLLLEAFSLGTVTCREGTQRADLPRSLRRIALAVRPLVLGRVA